MSNQSSARNPWAHYEPSGPLSAVTYSKKWHVTPRGEVKRCTAQRAVCPYGEALHVQADNQATAERAVRAQREMLDPTTPQQKYVLGKPGSPGYVSDPRDLATFSSQLEKERGVPADKVELEGELHLAQGTPVKVQRWVKQAGQSPDRFLAGWKLQAQGSNRSVEFTSFSPERIAQLLDPPGAPGQGVSFPVQTKSELEDARAEFTHQLTELIRTVESEASLASDSSVFKAAVPTQPRFSLDNEGRLVGRVSYGGSGFRPEHLRFLKSGSGIGEGFLVEDSDAGEGAAAWRMSFRGGEWVVEVTGTRGDRAVFTGSSPAEVRGQLETYFQKRVKARTLTSRARQLGVSEAALWQATAPRDSGRETQRANRLAFITDLMEEGDAYSSRSGKRAGTKGQAPGLKEKLRRLF